VLWLAAAGFSISAIHAQSCPPVNFVQGSSVTAFDHTYGSGYQRQPDGSFTSYRYLARSPYNKVATTPNSQGDFLNCSAAGARTFKTPAGWLPLADQPGAVSQSLVVSNFLGDGTVVGLAAVKGGYSGGPAVDSLGVVLTNPDGSGKSKTFYPVISHPAGVVVADLNHDGKKDVVVVSNGSTASPNMITVFLNKGDGTLPAGVQYPADKTAAAAVAFDFNGDGNLDLAVLNTGSMDVSILLGRGDGTFAAPVNYPVGAGADCMALGDFNGDGRADLVFGGGNNLSVLLGNGNGTFHAAVSYPQTFSAGAMVAADFNKDGKLDLAITDSLGGTVTILLGDGTGKFAGQYDYVAGYEPANLFAMDLDGDGNLDVVIAAGHPDVLAPNYYAEDIVVLFGRGDGTLMGAPVYKVGSRLGAVVLADFDGDGKPDVAVAAGDVWILLSRGGGSFKTPVRITMPLTNGWPAGLAALAVGDFNGDGRPDLVAGPAGDDGGVYVLLGNGDGTFQAPVHYAVGGHASSIAVADFNGDGKPDLAVCGHVPGLLDQANVGILLGNGNGTFQSVRSLTGFGKAPESVAVGDFNKDGKLDLAIANRGDLEDSTIDVGSVLVFLGLGNGSFQSPTSYPAGMNPTFVTAADVNGDGAQDLVVAAHAPNFVFKVAVLLGIGNGTFGPATTFTTGYGPALIAVADLNGDGKPDLAIAHCCGSPDVTIMLGNGDGTFQPDIHLPAAVSSPSLAVADLNGDGKPDLVIGLYALGASPVSVFLSFAPLSNMNGASFLSGPLAPDSFATAKGTGLATTTQSGGPPPYPTNLGGTTVSVRDSSGAQQLAQLSYVSPTQVNYVVPKGTALGQATVTVTAGNGTAAGGSVTIAAIDPGMFVFGGTNIAAAWVIRVHADNSQTYENAYAVTSGGALVAAPIDVSPASGQVFLELYGTGFRGHSSAANSVTVTAGGVSLPVSYAGQQGGASSTFPGLDQIDVLLPPSLAGKGDVTIQVTVDGQAANPCHVTIK
jgi:uncharacterized protein (TIGR03437 family)